MSDSAIYTEPQITMIRQHLTDLLESQTFAQAGRLRRFLDYVVSASLSGNDNQLNQYAIAIDVFDRDASFDPTTDAIVRVEAGRLRAKLLEYYDTVTDPSAVRIALPRKSYAARFQFTEPAKPSVLVDDKPAADASTAATLAVMPFVNMSADPEQEYFADGITEDLITDLSRLPGLGVIARQSVFVYKNTAVDSRRVCEELNADLLLEGSVRRSGQRVRINAQLIDGKSGQHCWAERLTAKWRIFLPCKMRSIRRLSMRCKRLQRPLASISGIGVFANAAQSLWMRMTMCCVD